MTSLIAGFCILSWRVSLKWWLPKGSQDAYRGSELRRTLAYRTSRAAKITGTMGLRGHPIWSITYRGTETATGPF